MFALESIFGGSRNQPSRKGTRSLHQHCSKTSPKPTSAVNILIWVSERLNLNHYVRLKRDQQYSQKLTNSFLTVFKRNAKGHQSNCLPKKKETTYSVGICQSQPDRVRKPANMKAIGRLSRRSGHIDQIQHGPNDCLLETVPKIFWTWLKNQLLGELFGGGEAVDFWTPLDWTRLG